ncbi:MAG: hypothetical protein EOP92_38195 [Lysobacteraceae bacterium]|nr:MAG: hypothetical protein EOP92_38195 [Xanthomonadaceae bacterium]
MAKNKAENKAENKDSGGRSLSDVQLDDFDVDRQRERLERSRPGNMQSGEQENRQQPGEANRQQGKP